MLWILGIGLVVPRLLVAQQQITIAGKIEDSEGGRMAGAEVVVTNVANRRSSVTKSDAAGEFSLSLTAGIGDTAVVFASAPPLGVVRRRVVLTGVLTRLTLVFAKVATPTLAGVRVVAQRVDPPESLDRDGLFSGVGGGEEHVSTLRGSVTPLEQGSISAMAQLQSGLASGPAGLSFLGAAPSENVTTMDGLSISSTRVPRSGAAAFKVAPSPLDIAYGGFSGVLLNVTPAKANRGFAEQTTALTFGVLSGGAALPSSAFAGRQETALLSLGARRSLFGNRIGVNASADLRGTALPAAAAFGDHVYRDACAACVDSIQRSAARFGIGAVGAAGGTPIVRDVAALLRVDAYRATDLPATAILSLNTTQADFVSALGNSTTTAGRSVRTAFALQANWAAVSPAGHWRHDVRFGGGVSTVSSLPASESPRVTIQQPYGGRQVDGIQDAISIGGAGTSALVARELSSEALLESQRRIKTYKSRLKFLTWVRVARATDGLDNAVQRSVNYPSPLALARGEPNATSYRREGSVSPLTTLNSAFGLGNLFETSYRLRVYTGVRLEAASLLGSPAGADDVFTATPTRVYLDLSPRIGIDYFTRPQPEGWVQNGGVVAAPFIVREPLGILRFGVGRFQSRLSASRVQRAQRDAAAAVAGRCVGAAVAPLRWTGGELSDDDFTCADGQPALSDIARPRTLLTPGSVAPPASWRATAGYSFLAGPIRVQADGRLALNQRQPLFRNANFAGSAGFALCDEGCRPVFVPVAAVDPRSGLTASALGRANPERGDSLVVETTTSRGGSLTLQLSPQQQLLRGKLLVSLSYTLARVTQRTNGFASTTFGDPRTIQTEPSPNQPTHAVVVQAGVATKRLIVSGSLIAQSGLPFAPIVASDLNGDGYANDRAFIPATSDSLWRVISTGSAPWMMRCLQQLRGVTPVAGSCRTPWSVRSTIRIDLRNGATIPGTAYPIRAALQIDNPIPVSATGPGVFGATMPLGARIDPVLLIPRGFEPQTRAFDYAGNPDFGRVSLLDQRLAQPRVVLDFSIDLSRPYDEQTITRALQGARRGEVRIDRSAAQIRRSYTTRMMRVFRELGNELDALGYPEDSVAAFGRIEDTFRAQLDSLWTPVSERVAALATGASLGLVMQEVRATERVMWDDTWLRTSVSLRALLGENRTAKLSASLRYLLQFQRGGGYIYFGDE
jgi:hypothetical protein